MEAVIPVVVILAVGGVFAFFWYRRQRAKRAWRAFANEYDFSFVEPTILGNFSMSGTYDGISCRVYTETRGSGDDSKTYTIYAAQLPEAFPLDFNVHEENVVTGVVEFFGGQDIQVGITDLDESFVFRSDQPDQVRELFTDDEIADAFRDLTYATQSVCIDSGAVQLEERGLQTSRMAIEAALDTISDFANRFERAAVASTQETVTDADAATSSSEGTDGRGDEPVEEPSDGDYVQHW